MNKHTDWRLKTKFSTSKTGTFKANKVLMRSYSIEYLISDTSKLVVPTLVEVL